MSKKILVVDDQPTMQHILRDIFVDQGYEVIGTAANGREALEMYKELKPDLVTMDMIMPEVDGITALRNILEYDTQAKVAMVTAINKKEALREAIKAGACEYLTKPLDDKVIISTVGKILK